jgi:tetraacyldisaccharide 4'-kinase
MNAMHDTLVRAWYRGAWWLYLLRPAELLFRCIAAIRRASYRSGLLNTYRAPVPVVIVGNITVGGTGKTPVVVALVQSLQQHGVRVGVISRGYGAKRLRAPYRVEADSTAAHCGDEPLLIYRRTHCPCVVAPSRAAAARALLTQEEVDILISDDGLQHYALQRDMEIALLDGERGTGNGFCLPAGPLREPAGRLHTVDIVLYRNGPDPEQSMHYTPGALVNLASGERRSADPAVLAQEVHAVAGLAQPEQFFESLIRQGFSVSEHSFADHYNYTAADFSGLQDKPIIMTEKDAVKCRGIAGDNAWYLSIDAQLPAAVTSAVVALARPVHVTE